MVKETPRLGLNTYEQGDENWSHTDAVEAVDEHAIKRGPISDRPDEGEYDDELFAAIDQRIIWRWDESESDWEAFSGLGSDGEPVPGTSHFEALEAESVSTEDLNNALDSGSVGSIQDAVDRASPGQTILVSDVHEEDLRIDTEDITLLGWGGIIRTPADASFEDDEAAIRVFADGVSIRNVEIDGNRDNQDLTRDGSAPYDDRYADGVSIYADDVTVEGCDIYDCVGHGIIVWNEPFPRWGSDPEIVAGGARKNIKVNNSTVRRCETRSGIDLASTDPGSDLNFDITVKGNTVIGEDNGSKHQHGITVHTGKDSILSNNTVRNVERGINVHSDALDIDVKNNLVTDVRGVLVRVSESEDVSVKDNRLKNTPSTAVFIENNSNSPKVKDNVIQSANVGIYSVADSSSIVDNNIDDVNTRGVYIDGGGESKIDDNVIRNAEDGVEISGDGCRIVDNDIRESTTGVVLNNDPENTYLNHNYFDVTGDDISGSSGAGSDTTPNFTV